MVYGNNIFGLVMLAAAVWVIYDVWAVNKKMPENTKILWTILAVIGSVIAAIIYYFVYKRE